MKDEEYRGQLSQKWRAVLTAAAYHTRATCLVIPDAGCGAIQNSVEAVASAFGDVLGKEFWGRFDEVIVASPTELGQEFATVARKVFPVGMPAYERSSEGRNPDAPNPSTDSWHDRASNDIGAGR